MSEFDETNAGWIPVEGGAWVPAANGTPNSAPSWPPPPTVSAGLEEGAAGAAPPVPPAGGWREPGVSGPAQPPPEPPSPRRRRPLTAMFTAALVGVAGVAGLGLGHVVWPTKATVNAAAQGSATAPNNFGGIGSGSSATSGPSNPYGSEFGPSPSGTGGSSGGTADMNAIAAKVSPALVDINSVFSLQNAQRAGTGIVFTSNGEILTNNHVIDGATKISVTDIGNGKTYHATVVGYDSTHDIAVLQLQGACGLKTATLGDSAKAAVGESVVAIGNAGGTGGTPSNAGGSIVAVNQSITAGDSLDGASEQLSGLIQVNAGIQPGDSGGSLVNSAGQVIGIDTAASQSDSFQASATEGFAIPIDQALAVAQQVESGQPSTTVHVGSTAFLGVLLSAPAPASEAQGSPDNLFGTGPGSSGGPSASGPTISSVVSGGPAAHAGLAPGDVITSLGAQRVDANTPVSTLLIGHHPGDKINLGWVDSTGQSHTATVDLGSGPPA
jgi:S1-C subfamily serine protease